MSLGFENAPVQVEPVETVDQNNKHYPLDISLEDLGVSTFSEVTRTLLFNYLVAQEIEISDIEIPVLKVFQEGNPYCQIWILKLFGKGNTSNLTEENVYRLIDNTISLKDALQNGNRQIVNVIGNIDLQFDKTSIYKHYMPTIFSETSNFILGSSILNNIGDEVHFTNINDPLKVNKLIIPADGLEVPTIRIYYNNQGYVNTSQIEIDLKPNTFYRLINVFQGGYYLFAQSILQFENPLVYKLPNPVMHTGNTVETRLLSVNIGKITPSTIVSIKDLVFTSDYNGVANSTGNIIIRIRISDTDTIEMNENNNLSSLIIANNTNYFDGWAKMERTYAFSLNNNPGNYNLHRMPNLSSNTDVLNSFNHITYPFGYFENNKHIHITAELPAATPNSITVRSCIIYKY